VSRLSGTELNEHVLPADSTKLRRGRNDAQLINRS